MTKRSENLSVGDLVTIADGSYSIKLDWSDYGDTLSGGMIGTFKVIRTRVTHNHLSYSYGDKIAHDIIIENVSNGDRYLHSTKLTSPAPVPVKEVTMADLEAKYGCKIKVVKE